ncbi:MAG: PspC domain-containing protein [Trueperaceae bacterium]|nr:PspC domain-containing protein [Trueperaceae bacterium]
MTKTLTRSESNRVIGGVCAGLGHYFGVDPTLVRVIFLIAFFGFGVGPLVYFILWLLMPKGY